jgi:hypothetical protein
MRPFVKNVGVLRYNYGILKRKVKMKTVEHSLRFITELDENNPTAQRLLALDKNMQAELLEGMLHSLLVPDILPLIDTLNQGNSYAILKVVK